MQTFNLDLSAKRVIPLLNVKQRDVGTKILVRLTNNKAEYTIPEDAKWSVWYSGASGEGNYTEIDGRSAFDVEGSTVTVELIYQMLVNPGGGQMCLVMNGADGSQMGLWNIPYYVEAIPGADSEAAQQYYQAFLRAQKKAEEAADRAEAAAEKIAVDQEYIETQVFSVGTASGVAFNAAADAAASKDAAKADADRAEEAASRAEEAAATDSDRHAAYFTITENGVLYLKPEYRGDPANATYLDSVSDVGVGFVGSRIAELPEHLVIPEVVEEIAVDSIAIGAFCDNKVIKVVEFPKTIKHIPEKCFYNCYELEQLLNVEGVTTIDKQALQNTKLKKIYLPNLEQMGERAFAQCTYLTHANIGKVTELPMGAFYYCHSLSRVESEGLVTSVGVAALSETYRLANLDFVKNIKSIGTGAFITSAFDYEWSSLGNCTFGTNATSLQINPTDFWSDCLVTECDNPIPTLLCQDNPDWANRGIGASGVTYKQGCVFMAIMHAYCAFNNLHLSSVEEFENIVNDIKPGHLDTFSRTIGEVGAFIEPLGMSIKAYDSFNKDNLQALYDALADGKYALLQISSSANTGGMSGHMVVANGLTADGKIKCANSASWHLKHPTKDGYSFKLPYKVMCAPKLNASWTFCIIDKKA